METEIPFRFDFDHGNETVTATPASHDHREGYAMDFSDKIKEGYAVLTPSGSIRFITLPLEFFHKDLLEDDKQSEVIHKVHTVFEHKKYITFQFYPNAHATYTKKLTLVGNVEFDAWFFHFDKQNKLISLELRYKKEIPEDTYTITPVNRHAKIIHTDTDSLADEVHLPGQPYDPILVDFKFQTHQDPNIPHTNIYNPGTYELRVNGEMIVSYTVDQKFFLSYKCFKDQEDGLTRWTIVFNDVTEEQITTMVHEC